MAGFSGGRNGKVTCILLLSTAVRRLVKVGPCVCCRHMKLPPFVDLKAQVLLFRDEQRVVFSRPCHSSCTL
ncbi:hypothetical protein PLICRDRAFT_428648 [Plicaturopsis crispa FD-325 SS-3]|nr:hypothetical protein PLICRDRAFT_428648 [Plicaturopsis crispa FD-325 SS-3]